MLNRKSAQFFASHPVFTHEDYLSFYKARESQSLRTADSLLQYHITTGKILHIRRGLYATVPTGVRQDSFLVDPYLVGANLADDAVISHHAALQFRGKAYSVWQRFSVLTQKNLRPFSFQGNDFVGVSIPTALRKLPDFGGGIVTESYAGVTIRVTSFERTLVDVLHSPMLGGGWEEIWRSIQMIEYFDLNAVIDYTLKLGSALTIGRVGFFLETHRDELFVEDQHLQILRKHAPQHPCYFGTEHESGRFVKNWNLVVPQRVQNQTWAEVL